MEQKESWHELEEVEEGTEIPIEYLQRFERIALNDKALLVERSEAIEVMERAWSNWSHTSTALLVVGEMGSGLTSLVNCSCAIYPHARIIGEGFKVKSKIELVRAIGEALGFPDCTNFEELKKCLETALAPEDAAMGKAPDSTESPETDEALTPVLIFENIERLFLRKLNGFNLLEELLLFIHATKKLIYWIVTVNRYTAYYLDQIIDFPSNFSSILRLQPISGPAIEKMIEDRNSGYQLTFLKPEHLTNALAKKLKSADDVMMQSLLKDHFFKQLQSVASGNISTALTYWLKSVVYCREKKIYLRPYVPKPLGDLTLESLFILEAILLHRSLTPQDIKSVLRDHGHNSMLRMENLIERNLIEPIVMSLGEPEYEVNLLHIENLKVAMRSRLNRKIK